VLNFIGCHVRAGGGHHPPQIEMPRLQARLPQGMFRRIAAVVALACGNCGGEPVKTDRYVPAPELCRKAVEAVLVDWQEGLPAASIDRLAVKVNVVDQLRKPGQTLAEFEVLGEAPSATGRCLVVRLKYNHPDGEETARYIVVGIDPLWVFRQEDLDLMNRWDHPMPPAVPVESETESAKKAPDPDDERKPNGASENAIDERPREAR